jgi:peptidoglycan/xylan/chitin deacetylase (PgdA/CDA1 family)
VIYRRINITFLFIFSISFLIDWFYFPLPWWIYFGATLVYLGIVTYGVVKIDSQFFIPVIFKAGILKSEVAITFDDGPHPQRTPYILDILKEYDAKAAFFCIGKNVDENPDIVRRIHKEGHLLGNHSFFHSDFFDFQSTKKMEEELSMTDDAIKEVSGRKPRFFRPPYGVTNPRLAKVVKNRNYVSVGWSLRSLDTIIKNEKRLFNKIKKRIKPGDIILFHDHSVVLTDILPEILEYIRNIGLKIVRVDELIEEKPYA